MKSSTARRRALLTAIFTGACLALLLTGGCARTPSGISNSLGRQLIITMTVAGTIDATDDYFVVFNTSNQQNATVGPVPPVAANWGGNGFVTGEATQYMEYNSTNPNNGYVLGNFNVVGQDNLQIEPPNNYPIDPEPITTGSNTISFRIPLSYLATSSISGSDSDPITAVQINFINTNELPAATTSQLTSAKLFDALGDTAGGNFNTFVTIPTTQDGSYGNTITGAGDGLEPSYQDVAQTFGAGVTATSDPDAPNLDIRNWSVQVTN